MKLIAQRDDLSRALDKVELALSSGIDLYRQILLEVDGKWAVLTGTNTTTTIKTALKVGHDEKASLLLPPEIARAVRSFDHGEVTLSKTASRLELVSEHGPKFRFGFGESDSYPKIEFKKTADFTLPHATFAKVIHYLSAIRTDVVALEGSDKTLLFTDNFRLGIIDLGITHDEVPRVLMPMSLFTMAEKVLTPGVDVEVIVEDRRVTLRQGMSGNAISTLRTDAKFPDLKSLIARLKPTGNLVAMKAELLGAADRAAVVASNLIPMKLDLKSGGRKVLVSASRSEVGESDERINGTWTGGDLEISINVGFLVSIISVLGPKITMDFGGPNDMFSITSEDDPMAHFIMMPVRKRD